MKIQGITIKNVLGVTEEEITPDGNIVEIKGSNGSGKTSISEAILDVLGVSHYSTLLRNGEKNGETVIDLGEMILTKKYNESGSKLSIKGKVAGADNYSTISSPAKVLKGLISPNSVDPVRLLTATDKELVSAVLDALPMKVTPRRLKRLVGDREFDQDNHALEVISKLQTGITLDRRDINRDMKVAKTTMQELEDTLPDHIPKTDEITAEIDEQQEILSGLTDEAYEAKESAESKFDLKIALSQEKLKTIEDQITKLLSSQAVAEAEVSNLLNDKNESGADAFDSKMDESKEINNNISELQNKLSEVAGVSKTVERVNGYKDVVKSHSEQSEVFTGQLEGLDKYKEDLCSNLPIDGLELNNGKLELSGVPFSTLNTAARIKLVIELAKLGAGELGLVVLDNSEHLDSKMYKEFLAQARDTDLQFVVCRVSDEGLEVK